MQVVRCEGRVDWQAFRDKESGRYVGVCAALNLATEGDTWQQLGAMIHETMALLFRDLMESGELDEFLRQHGWRCEVPNDTSVDEIDFDIPAPISMTERDCATT